MDKKEEKIIDRSITLSEGIEVSAQDLDFDEEDLTAAEVDDEKEKGEETVNEEANVSTQSEEISAEADEENQERESEEVEDAEDEKEQTASEPILEKETSSLETPEDAEQENTDLTDHTQEPVIEELSFLLENENTQANEQGESKESLEQTDNPEEPVDLPGESEDKESEKEEKSEPPIDSQESHDLGLDSQSEVPFWKKPRFLIASLASLMFILLGIIFMSTKPQNRTSQLFSGLQGLSSKASSDKAQRHHQKKPLVFTEHTESFILYFNRVPKPFILSIRIKIKIPKNQQKTRMYIRFRDYLYQSIQALPLNKQKFTKWELILVKEIQKIVSNWPGVFPVHFIEVSEIKLL